MPRIPVRVEPYSSPQRKQRHFKNKRDQILRALGKASYINGSHFAILWVNSRGETEQYASELFQSKLGAWFNQDVISQARQMVCNATEAQATLGNGMTQYAEREIEEEDDIQLEAEDEDGLEQDDTMIGGSIMSWEHASDLSLQKQKSEETEVKGSAPMHVIGFADAVKQRSQQAPELRRTFSMPSPSLAVQTHGSTATGPSTFKSVHGQKPRPTMLDIKALHESQKFHLPQGPPDSSNPEYKALTIGNQEEVTMFLETRFRQLQQLVCKIVAKAWIKVIEPKKQTRYPYNKGEESKPVWWPEDVRHKEPDHLKKIERITLLMTMLHCGKVPTNRLELATAEVAAFIPPDKINLLREIYRVGREEERFRCSEIPAETRIFVAATTAINTLGMDDLNSPSTAGTRPVNENHTPRSGASLHDTHMTLQRSMSHHTSHFDEHDPFVAAAPIQQNTEMQQGYAMLPPQSQSFYYQPDETTYARQSNAAVMSAANTNHVLANQQFQQTQQQQMFVPQQAQAQRQSVSAPLRTSQTYTPAPWPQDLESPWPHNSVGGMYQQPNLVQHAAVGPQHHNSQNSQTFTYAAPSIQETPAKQTQRSHQDNHSLRSSPYLPTPMRPEGHFSASRGQGVSFSDYLNSPRTGGPGPMHEAEHLHTAHDSFH